MQGDQFIRTHDERPEGENALLAKPASEVTPIEQKDVATSFWIVETVEGLGRHMTAEQLLAEISAGTIGRVINFAVRTAYPQYAVFIDSNILYRALVAIEASNTDDIASLLSANTIEKISDDEVDFSEVEAAIAAETTARQSADTALNTKIDAETTARQNADTALGQRITDEGGLDQTEVDARAAARYTDAEKTKLQELVPILILTYPDITITADTPGGFQVDLPALLRNLDNPRLSILVRVLFDYEPSAAFDSAYLQFDVADTTTIRTKRIPLQTAGKQAFSDLFKIDSLDQNHVEIVAILHQLTSAEQNASPTVAMTGIKVDIFQAPASLEFEIGGTLPENAIRGDVYLLDRNVDPLPGGTLDADGETPKTSATAFDFFVYNGTAWQFVGFLGVDGVVNRVWLDTDGFFYVERSNGLARLEVDLNPLRHIPLIASVIPDNPTRDGDNNIVSANQFTISVPNHSGTYSDADQYEFTIPAGNTGSVQLRVRYSGGGSVFDLDYAPLLNVHGHELNAGDLSAGELIEVRYDTELDKWISHIHQVVSDSIPGLMSPAHYNRLKRTILEYNELPTDLSLFESGQIILVDRIFYKNHSTPAANIFAGEVSEYTNDGFGINDASHIGHWTSNPKTNVAFFHWNYTPHNVVTIAVDRAVYRAAKGSNEADGDQMRLEITTTDENNVTRTGNIDVTIESAIRRTINRGDRIYIAFQASIPANSVLDYIDDAGDTITFAIKKTDGTDFITHAAELPHWTEYRIEDEETLFKERGVEVLDTVPDASEYQGGKIIIVDETFYKHYETEDANVIKGVVGHANLDGNGIQTGYTGRWTDNPKNAVYSLLANPSLNQIEVAISRDAFRAAKGSNEVDGDHVELIIVVDGGTATTTLVNVASVGNTVEYNNITYLVFRASIAATHPLLDADVGDELTLKITRDNADFITHPASLAHWNEYPVYDRGVREQLNTLTEAAVTSTTINSIVKITQTAYDALATKDNGTLYVIVG